MKKRTVNLTDELYQYMLDVSLHEPEIMLKLRQETRELMLSFMQSPVEESQFISLLIKLIGATKILEIGTFTGYTTLWMAQSLPDNGQVVTCDLNNEWVNVGKKYWEKAGVDHKIRFCSGPALETLGKLIDQGEGESFDFVFIDADKENYVNYYKLAMQLVKLGGVIAVDNVFWSGSVVKLQKQGPDVTAIRKVNEMIHADPRLEVSMLPIGDGLTLARRKA